MKYQTAKPALYNEAKRMHLCRKVSWDDYFRTEKVPRLLRCIAFYQNELKFGLDFDYMLDGWRGTGYEGLEVDHVEIGSQAVPVNHELQSSLTELQDDDHPHELAAGQEWDLVPLHRQCNHSKLLVMRG